VEQEAGEYAVPPRQGIHRRSVTATGEAPGELLDQRQRRVLLGVCLVVGAATTVPASYNYVIVPMLQGLGASESQGSLLRQLPSIAGLLVIFLAGILGRRWGERRFITRCAVLYTVGNAAVALAPGMGVAVAGLVLESVGATGFLVVTLALLSAEVADDEARASAFATYAMVAPIVYLGMPPVVGLIVDHSSWRLVAAIWALSGLVILGASRRFLPRDEAPHDSRELLTPALAGVVLMAAVQTVSAADRDGMLSAATLVRLGIGSLALAALFWAFRRADPPSLSLAALRQGGMSLLLIIVILVSFANLWFYMTVGFQYLYGLNALQTSVAMLPAQAAGIGGAILTRRVLRKRGITAAGMALLLALAGSLLLSAVITADSPIWVPIVVMVIYAAASVGAGIPLTNAVMNLAPQGEDGSASAFRSAAGNIGGAVGVIVMTTIVFTTFSASLGSTLEAEGLNSQQSVGIAESIRAGVTSEHVAANYSVPLQQVEEIAEVQRQAMTDGLRAHGLSGAAITGVCLVIFYWSRRRET
jgi:MFS transporter, DHA2 family, multidrug resistance protein